jgi:hypothetical protein
MAFAGVERQGGGTVVAVEAPPCAAMGGRRARARQASKYDLLDIPEKSDNLIIRL